MFSSDGGVLEAFHGIIATLDAMAPEMQHRAGSKLMSFLGRLSNPAEIGAQFGRRVPLTAYGDAALGVKTAPTFGHVLRLISDFHHLIVPLMDYVYTETSVEGRLVVGFRAPIDAVGEVLLTSWAATQFEQEVFRWTGRSGNIKGLELTPSSREFEAIYRKNLRVRPETNHDKNVIIFSREVLEIPNPTADKDAYESVVAAYSARDGLSAKSTLAHVRERIMSNISDPPPVQAMAKALNLTSRQLRSALTKEKTNYQDVLRSCRVEYAEMLLARPALSIFEVARRLGYSDSTAFTHSFTRWTGKSPSARRIELLHLN